MAKVSFANMKLKINDEVKTFDFNGNQIEVKQYLPISDKYDLINITLQESKRTEGYYDPVQMDKYFNLNLVYMYSNINFTDKQKEDADKLYDLLESNGLIDEIVKNMNEDEYATIYGLMEETMNNEMQYTTTAAALIKSIISDLPRQAEAAANIVNNFDKDKFEAVKQFAEAANRK